MIISTVLAALCCLAPIDDTPIKCAVMGSPTKATSVTIEYAGAKFPMCCGGCNSTFLKEPQKFIKEAAKGQDAVGMFLFCPVSGEKLDMKNVKETVTYHGIKYGFCCPDCIGEFKKDPAKYAKTPEKESLTCPVSGEAISAYSASAGYVDHKGVRYFACCGDCVESMKKDMDAVLAKGKAKVAAPHAMATPKSK